MSHPPIEIPAEITIRAWRVVTTEHGVFVFVDPRHETVRIFEGMDPRIRSLPPMDAAGRHLHDTVTEHGRQLHLFDD